MDRRSTRRRIIDSTSVPICRRKERKICGAGDAELSSATSDETFSDGHAGNNIQGESKPSDDASEDGQCVDADTGIGTSSEPPVPREDANDIEVVPEANSGVSISLNEYVNDSVEGKEEESGNIVQASDKMSENDSVFGDIGEIFEVFEPNKTEQTAETERIKPWMLPTRNIQRATPCSAIPDAISREMKNKDFLLPWRSIDQDDTHRIKKPAYRRSGRSRVDSEPNKHISEYGHSIPRVRKTSFNDVKGNTHETSSTIQRKDSFSLELIESDWSVNNLPYECSFQKTNVKRGLETKDPYSIELEKTKTDVDTCNEDQHVDFLFDIIGSFEPVGTGSPPMDMLPNELDDTHDVLGILEAARDVLEENMQEAYSNLMEDQDGTPRLLTVEEKWQIIFNEKTRAPIFAVAQYVDYLAQYVSGKGVVAATDKDRIDPVSYLLRKLKLDLKMSYDSFVEEFLKPGNSGMALLIKLLKFIQNTGTQQSGSANKAQLKNYKKTLTDEHDCLLCIKFALRIKTGLTNLLEVNYGLETIAMSLLSSFTKSRGTAIEILTITLAASEGFSRTLDSFTYIQLKIGEPVRFKSLINMMNMDSQHNTIFKVSCMKFMNCLLDAATNLNVRVYLQHELQTAGLDVDHMTQRTTGTGLEYDELRHELAEWNRKFVRVEEIMSQKNILALQVDAARQDKIEELQRKVKMLTLEKTSLEHQLKATRDSLERSNEELHRRVPSEDKETQVPESRPTYTDAGCQCQPEKRRVSKNPLFDAELTGALKAPSSHHGENNAVATFQFQPEDEEVDENGVEKVQQWLDSQSDVTADGTNGEDAILNNKQKLKDSIVRKAEFPGNWRFLPKTLVPFPSRFQNHQCHKTNCDRCDIRNRPENLPVRQKQQAIVQTVSAELSQQEVLIPKKKHEVKSESSDSAIGGSGDRWQPKDTRIALLPVEVNEAEILQDMIEPDDSASGCRSNEPFPDYSVVSGRVHPRQSFRSEISEVLREFEGNLNEYDSLESFPNFSNLYTGHFVTLGQV